MSGDNASGAARIGDEAVRKATGRGWTEWLTELDGAGAQTMRHREIVAMVSGHEGVGPWWRQMVAVTYEQARGLCQVHEKPEGFEVSASRTVAAPVSRLFEAWTEVSRRPHWLPEPVTVRRVITNRSLRLDWDEGATDVEVLFHAKDDSRTQVTVQHRKLPDAEAAARMKVFWKTALERLAGSVASVD
jgi:uncharacterized protein YndB with AHSA1/START domain